MDRRTRNIGIAAVAAVVGIGTGVAMGAVGGDSSGTVTLKRSDFTRSARGKTLTINGIPFARGRGKTLTINGTSFKGSRGKTLTINGSTEFKGSRGKTLTINGTEFKGGRGKTLTINGTEFKPGSGAQGPAGPPGATGPSGPGGLAGASAKAGAPVVVAGPKDAALGAADPVELTSAAFTSPDGRAHRLLVNGTFDVGCNPCGSAAQPTYDVRRPGENALVTRRLPPFAAGGITDMSAALNEVVETPAGCNPCTYSLRFRAAGTPGGQATTLQATAIRLTLVDLGAV